MSIFGLATDQGVRKGPKAQTPLYLSESEGFISQTGAVAGRKRNVLSVLCWENLFYLYRT